jgi:hypothetical protein
MRAGLLGLLLLMPGVATTADTVVYPTGSYPADVQAVQAAADDGGTVLLKATNADGQPTAFAFGPPVDDSGWVELTRDVEIRGERVGQAMTTIRGGFFPIQEYVQARTAVKGIHFDNPRGGGVFLGASSGANISDNVITDVVGFDWFFAERKATGVWLGGGCCTVSGNVTIARNTIANLDAEDGLGLALVAFEGDVKVIGNDIRGTNFMGILAFDHTGRVTIEDNTVIPGPQRFPGAFFTAGNGIQVGPLNFFFPDPPKPALVVNNRVTCENPFADGIILFGYGNGLHDSVVTNNRVEMKGSLFGGITLLLDVSNTLVASNRVRGDGAYALDVLSGGDPSLPNQGNIFVANDTRGFRPELAHVLLDSSSEDTWVIGCQGTVIDEGTNNHIVGCPLPLAAAARPLGSVSARTRHARRVTREGRCPAVAAANHRLASAAGCAP